MSKTIDEAKKTICPVMSTADVVVKCQLEKCMMFKSNGYETRFDTKKADYIEVEIFRCGLIH